MANINPITGKTNEQVLAESTAAAKAAAEKIGGTFTQGVGLSLPSADKLADAPNINVSNLQGEVPASVNNAVNNISTAASGTSAYLQSLQKQIESAQADYKAQSEAALKGMGDLATNRNTTNISDLKTSLYSEYGIPAEYEKLTALAPEISSLQEKINAIDTAEAQSIENLRSQPISEIVAEGREARIKRQAAIERSGYSAELSAKTALAEMYKGNITLAQSMVSDAVNTATYDIQQQNANLDKLYTYYGDFLSTLDKTTQNQLSSLRDELKTEEANQREDKTNVLNLMLQYPDAGINVTDALMDATNKANSWKQTNPTYKLQELNGTVYKVDERGNIVSTVSGGADKMLSVSEALALGVPFGTTESQAKGITPTSQQQKNTVLTLSKSDVIIKQIKDAIDKVNLADTAIGAKFKGLALNAQALAKTNVNAVAYKSLSQGLLAQLARATGEVGVLTDQDIARAKSLIPTFYDTKETATAKLEQLQSFFTDLKASASGQGINQSGNNDPLGIF